jgi:hypothetical protein
MKKLLLQKKEHIVKIGDKCGNIVPNILEDCIFYNEEGTPVGFYLKKMNDRACKLADIANAELLSKNVPKQEMSRGPQGNKQDKLNRLKAGKNLVTQFSTIIGSVPPKPHMRRPYPSRSSVHLVPSAATFIKAMWMLAIESENIIRELMPAQYAKQVELFKNVDKKWRFGNLFTSSISNYNINADYHRDAGNIIGAVNVIITKRNDATGGDLNIPDYGITIDQCDNSMLVYPAWMNIHGVTPIKTNSERGYRNSLIFYPLKAFVSNETEKAG